MIAAALMPAAARAEDSDGRFEEENGKVYFYQDVTASLPGAQSGFTYEFKYALNADRTATLVVANAVNSAHYAGATLQVLGTITYQGEDYTVNTIGQEAFRYSKVKAVRLPDTITTIESGAFIYCYDVEEINIPDSVTSLGKNAFWTCHSLKEIHIPSRITEIPEGAFLQCWSVTELTIPSNIKTIGKDAFSGLGDQSGAEINLIIPQNVTSVGYEAFARTKAIRTVTVEGGRSENLQLNGAFRVCNELETVDIQSGAVTIGNNEFQACPKIGRVTLADGITTIGDWAFDGATALTEVMLPSSVASLGSGAFYECVDAVIYYPSSAALANSYTLGNTQTQVAYSVNADGQTVTIDEVTGTALTQTPGTVNGLKVSAVPEAYKPEDKHIHFFGVDDTQAYCAICGRLDPDHQHVWDDKYTVDQSPSCTEPGSESIHCKSCDATKDARTIPETGHEAGTAWDKDETYHWQTCAHCGNKINEEAHTLEWIVDQPATATEDGLGHKACKVCGYATAQEKIPAAGTDATETSTSSQPATTTSTPTNTSTDTATDTPQTGDSGNPGVWLTLLLASGACLAGGLLVMKKRNNQS